MSNGGVPETMNVMLEALKLLERLRGRNDLDKLYPIKLVQSTLVFGARPKDGHSPNWEKTTKELALVLETTGVKATDINVKILTNPQDEVELVMAEIAPYVSSHGGFISVVSADENSGLVVLNLQGACSGCPSSVATLKIGIERILQDALPWVREVNSDQEPVEPDFGFHLPDPDENQSGGVQ